MKHLFFSLCLIAAAVGAVALRAAETPATAQAQFELEEAWTARLGEATQRRDAAAIRLADDEAALSAARHRRYPRGEALHELERNLDKSRTELATAKEAVPELLEEARKAGVSPALLRRFEAE